MDTGQFISRLEMFFCGMASSKVTSPEDAVSINATLPVEGVLPGHRNAVEAASREPNRRTAMHKAFGLLGFETVSYTHLRAHET